MVAVQDKRSNLQPQPEIKFEPSTQQQANFKSRRAQI